MIKTPQYDTMLFCEVWDDVSKFKTEFAASPFVGAIKASSPDNVTLLFYLLYGKYGNNPIANFDLEQFKMKLFSIIFMYGPAWEKRLDIQNKLRALSDDDILIGSKAIYNQSMNPSTEPSTSSLDELTTINTQNTTAYKRSKMEAYGQLWDLISTDVTASFLDKFKDCFKVFVRPEQPLLYVSDEEEE